MKQRQARAARGEGTTATLVEREANRRWIRAGQGNAHVRSKAQSHTLMASSTSPIPMLSSLPKVSSSKSPHLLTSPPKPSNPLNLFRRRDFLTGIALISTLPAAPLVAGAREVEVGSYLPPSTSDPSFVVFKATSKDTPALRAGTFGFKDFLNQLETLMDVDQDLFQSNIGNVEPYQFMLPPSWKQARVANILSGNYCQPKCAEPWVEVKFEDEKQGKVQVVASPLVRLTNKPNASIEEIGSPEKVISSLGPFVTGNTYDSDELLEASIEKLGDQTYYKYVLETPLALTGSHNLAKATAKGNSVVLFVASANDKQWSTSQKTLQAILDSFQI